MNRASCPIKTESLFPVFIQPLSSETTVSEVSPLYCSATPVILRDTAGERCKNLLTLSFFCFLTLPSLRATSPIAHTCAEEEVNVFLLNCLCFLLLLRFYVQHSRNATGHGRGGGEILLTNILTLQYISFGAVGA
jgi:hypothetical protein